MAGLIFIGLGIFAYQLGLSASPGTSAGKVILVALGLLSAAVALLWKRTISAYKVAAIIFLNTLVLFGVLEVGLLLLSRSRDFLSVRPRADEPQAALLYVDDGRERLPYYLERDWSREYWREYHFIAENLIKYEPFTVWRAAAYRGKTINISEEGLRETPGASCSDGAFIVFAFGGSTMWGTGVPDWGTVPAYLQREIPAPPARPVCVVNYGEQGYVSTQSVIQLLLALQRGRIPDLALFYSGSNDVFAAYQSARAGVHQNLSQVAAKLEDRDEVSPVLRLLAASRTFTLVRRLTDRQGFGSLPFLPRNRPAPPGDLAASVAEVYLANHEVVGALAARFGFDFVFFWQPNLLTERKPLTREEASIRDVALGVYPGLVELLASTRERIDSAARERPNLHNIDRVFEQETSLVYVDPWHVTMEGNEILARAMLRALPASSHE